MLKSDSGTVRQLLECPSGNIAVNLFKYDFCQNSFWNICTAKLPTISKPETGRLTLTLNSA